MPDRKLTCVDCWASRTFPDGDWDKDQRPAIDAWARAHELAVHDGQAVSSWDLDPDPAHDHQLPGAAQGVSLHA